MFLKSNIKYLKNRLDIFIDLTKYLTKVILIVNILNFHFIK